MVLLHTVLISSLHQSDRIPSVPHWQRNNHRVRAIASFLCSQSLLQKKRAGLLETSPLRERYRTLLLHHQFDVGVLQARALDFSQGLVHGVLLVNRVDQFGLVVLLSNTPQIRNQIE